MSYTELELLPGEQLLMQGPANKWQTFGSKGGKLYLTNQRIVFKAHALNFGSKFDAYHLTDIQVQGNTLHIFTSSNAGFSANITFYTRLGEKLSFVVTNKQRDAWIQGITYAVTAMVRNHISFPQNTPPAYIQQYTSQIRVERCESCGAWVILQPGVVTNCDYCARPYIG